MSIGEIKRFNKDIQNEPSLRDEIKAIGVDVKKVITLANSKGYDFDEEDLKAYTLSQKSEINEGELTDEEVERVSGGCSVGVVVAAVLEDGVVVYGLFGDHGKQK